MIDLVEQSLFALPHHLHQQPPVHLHLLARNHHLPHLLLPLLVEPLAGLCDLQPPGLALLLLLLAVQVGLPSVLLRIRQILLPQRFFPLNFSLLLLQHCPFEIVDHQIPLQDLLQVSFLCSLFPSVDVLTQG